MHLLEQIEARRHPRHMVFCDNKFQFFKVFEGGFGKFVERFALREYYHWIHRHEY